MMMEKADDSDAIAVDDPHAVKPEADHGDDDETAVWQSFDESVAYVRNLSALYSDAFLKKASVPTQSHLDAAKEHAREALELLASNLLNASAAIVAAMENQEEQLAGVDVRLDLIKRRLREQQEARDNATVSQFFERQGDHRAHPSINARASDSSQGSLKLTLAASATSAPHSPYLYL